MNLISDPQSQPQPAKITPVVDGPEFPVQGADRDLGDVFAGAIGASNGDVVVRRIEQTRDGRGAWVTVEIFCPVTTPAGAARGICQRCGMSYAPSHDPLAEGHTVLHAFEPQPEVSVRGVDVRDNRVVRVPGGVVIGEHLVEERPR